MTLSPLARRRLANFRANRRGYTAFRVFLVLFVISLFADLVANDRPLLVIHDDRIYLPLWQAYPETVFGGELLTETDYHDPYIQQKILARGSIIWPVIPYSFRSVDFSVGGTFPSPPDSNHWLGTDDRGRDVLARAIHGFRISILFGLGVAFFSLVAGVTAGAVQGYTGGRTDLFLQRLMEIWGGMPVLFLLVILASVVTPGFWWLLGIVILFSWMGMARLVRAEFLRGRNFEYVLAARALGVPAPVIMFRHILPNAMVTAVTFTPFEVAGGIGALTSLDFLGFGLPPGYPSLGELVAQGKNNLQAPWLGGVAFVTIAGTLTLLIFIGEAVRDAFDPRKIMP